MNFKLFSSVLGASIVMLACGQKDNKHEQRNLEQELATTRQELAEKQTENDRKASDNQAQLQKAQQERDKLTAQLAEREIESAALSQEVSEKKEKTNVLTSLLLAEQAERKDLEVELKTEKAKIELLTKSIDKQKSDLATLNKALTESQGDKAELKAQVDALTASIQLVETNLAKAHQERDELKRQIATLSRESSESIMRLAGITEETLAPKVGIFRNADKITAATESECFKFVEISGDGSVVTAIACANGNVETMTAGVARFDGGAPQSATIGYYGLSLPIKNHRSPCGVSQQLVQGDLLRFEHPVGHGNDLGTEVLALTGPDHFEEFQSIALEFISPTPTVELATKIAEGYNYAPYFAAALAFVKKKSDINQQGCFDRDFKFTPKN